MTVSISGTTGYSGPMGSLTVPVASINATGTPSSTTFLRGDGTWNAPAGGVTSATAGTGMSVSASTGAVTFTNTGVTSFVGQTGAVDPTVFGAIGNTLVVAFSQTTLYLPGASVAGNTCFYQSAGSSSSPFISSFFIASGSDKRNATTTITNGSASTWTPLTGTWRVVSGGKTSAALYDACTNNYFTPIMVTRIA